MDSTYILPIVIVVGVLAIFGVILWATSGFGLFKSGSDSGNGSGSGSGNGSGGNGSGGSGGSGGNGSGVDVCVSQIKNWLTTIGQTANTNATGATGAHILFYNALDPNQGGGIPSSCSQLMIQLIDENGDSEIDFKWNNGVYIPTKDISKYKNIKGSDVLEFKVMNTMNSSCDVDSGQGCPNGGLCVCSAARNDCVRTHPVEYDSKGNPILPSDWCAKNVPCNGTCYVSDGFEVLQVVLNN